MGVKLDVKDFQVKSIIPNIPKINFAKSDELKIPILNNNSSKNISNIPKISETNLSKEKSKLQNIPNIPNISSNTTLNKKLPDNIPKNNNLVPKIPTKVPSIPKIDIKSDNPQNKLPKIPSNPSKSSNNNIPKLPINLNTSESKELSNNPNNIKLPNKVPLIPNKDHNIVNLFVSPRINPDQDSNSVSKSNNNLSTIPNLKTLSETNSNQQK